jgi:DNA-binding transcriptional MocR family regulator
VIQEGTVPMDLSGPAKQPPAAALALFREHARSAAARVDLGAPVAPLGVSELRAWLAETLGSPIDEVAVTCGVRSSAALLAPGLRRVVVETPSFPGVPEVLRLLGCAVRRRSWDSLLPGEADAALWLTHPARNPDGACLSGELLARLRGSAWRLVVVNEVYRWHAPTTLRHLPPGWVAVGSFAKVFGPAARIGWVRGPAVRALSNSLLRTTAPAPVVQWTWSDFLASGGLGPLVAEAAAESAAADAFRRATTAAVAGRGPNVLVRPPGFGSSGDALAALAARAVKAAAGPAFGAPEPSVRLTFPALGQTAAREVAELVGSAFAGTTAQPGR